MPELKVRQQIRQLPKLKLPKLPKPSRLPRSVRLHKLKTWQYTAGAATVGLALAVGTVTAAGPWDSGQRTAERDLAASRDRDGGADHGRAGAPADAEPAPAPSAPGVLAALGAPAGSAPAPTGQALADVLDPLLRDPSLGARRTASVVDVATGKQVYAAGAGDAVTPASTTKIATAAAALKALGPDHRLVTKAVAEPDSKEVALVGAGDPTLTARKDANGDASLRALAADTAKALKERGTEDGIRLTYDTSLYSGPDLHPIGRDENLAPVSALMADEARLDDSRHGTAWRSTDPAGDAARKFADLLRDQGVKIEGEPGPTKAGDHADTLAKTESAPLSALVERMLTHSDNDIAEALARQAALASGEPASFDGAERAVAAQLKKLQLPLSGTRFADGSGLNRADRLTAELLTALLARAADPAHPELRPILTGLPIAGFTGTLQNRYPSSSPGTGLVRAKTGTLTGVNTLAGTVVDADGRLLAFAFTAMDTTNRYTAQATLDRMASTLANCGCRET
ncbi:D-alanyl-D-alanine carboxypeptidase/D-alanyl-D-alanine endopeptidase [Streptomyces sp. NBC_01304]|uniref:D-alanyl-D-alanine carboxypeptidase/D-alanyl-D-alanine endopeptidase n=1 Tax=Streptomyces sp. NBC_01304 TaxID=2903818 RepID=UPI003FA3C1B5